MAQSVIKSGQTWWDVGVELTGAWEAGIDLAIALGRSMTDAPPLGEVVKTTVAYNRPMEAYCHAEGVSPATALEAHGPRWQIFSPVFNTIYR